MDIAEVVKSVQAGDIEAFSKLVEKYRRHLLDFIYRLSGDERSVEEHRHSAALC